MDSNDSKEKLKPLENETLESQFKRFATLRHLHPEKCKQLYDDGEKMIEYSSRGQFSKLRMLLNSLERKDILLYHSCKMFIESLKQGHLMISAYIIESGYPYLSFGLPHALHEVLNVVEDYRGVEITAFLTERGYDINMQEEKNWLSPLHIAIKRELIETIKIIIKLGGDINAIARGDIMPLKLAEDIPTSSIYRNEIIALLLEKGARSNWRRNQNTSVLRSFSSAMQTDNESSSCVFKSINKGSISNQVFCSFSSSTSLQDDLNVSESKIIQIIREENSIPKEGENIFSTG